MLLCHSDTIEPQHLPPEILAKTAGKVREPITAFAGAPSGAESVTGPGSAGPNRLPPGLRMDDIERAYILETLRQLNWNKTQAAKQLDIGLKTLYRKIEKYGFSAEEAKEGKEVN
jgi:transcriptional regulator of acetoin/glycerol metabolism